MKKWTPSELRAEYGLAAEWEAKMRNMPCREREVFLEWCRKTRPKDLMTDSEYLASLPPKERQEILENREAALWFSGHGI